MPHTARILALLLALGATAGAGVAESFTGPVLAVPSGDVLRVARAGQPVSVRLYGVAAPAAGQTHHEAAAQFLRERVHNKPVRVEVLTTDNQEHLVAKVATEDGRDLGVLLVEQGHAWWDEPNAPEASDLKRKTAEAIGAQRGLWAEGVPLAPWDFRRSNELDAVAYELDEAPAPAAEEEEAPLLAAKGDAQSAPPALAPDAPSGTIDARNLQIDTRDLNLGTMLTRHNPRVATDANGNAIGITADQIAQLPGAAQFGLQNGDVITSVNGQPLRAFDPMGLYNQFKDAPQLNVEILRNGQRVNRTVRLR